MIFLIKKQKVPSLILLSKLINFYEAEALKPNEKSPNFIRTKDRHRITYVLVS